MIVETSTPPHEPLPACAVTTELDRLLADDALKLSGRNRRFLSFVVGEALAGRGDRIKAYTIAVDVFGRGEDFNPDNDPIVRIEAARLRAALAAYYGRPEAGRGLRIVLRPGSYKPSFELPPGRSRRDADPSRRDELDAGAAGAPAIRIEHRRDRPDEDTPGLVQLFATALTMRLVSHGFRVILPLGEGEAQGRFARSGEGLLSLSLSVHGLADCLRFAWTLLDARTGEVKLSNSSDRPSDDAPDSTFIDRLTDSVVRHIEGAVA